MIKPLTSLRFFFALCVFLSHLSFLRTEKHYKDIFTSIFSEGFLGVSFFFILSGFILALNYREKFKNKNITIKKFYVARFARIYPLHIVTMFASMPVLFGNYKILFCNALLLQSYIPNQSYFFSYNAPSWSISDEAFFYIFFPILIIISYKSTAIIKTALLISFSILILYLNKTLPQEKTHYWLYISPFIRIFDFILGILLYDVCLYLKKINLKLSEKACTFFEIGSLLILALFFMFRNEFSISYRYSIYYWLPMCLIILSFTNSFISGQKGAFISRILSWKWVVYLGEISFGFYLIHYLTITYLSNYNGFKGIYLEAIPLTLVIFLITLITSIFTFEMIEKPFNKKIKNIFS